MTTVRSEVTLFDICSPKQWPTLASSELLSTGYPVYGANGVIGYYDKYTHKDPTILITCRGATCGKINISHPYSFVMGNAMALDNLNEKKVSLRYLSYALEYDGLKSAITGSAQPQITLQSLKNVKIYISSLEEQKQIENILDKINILINSRKQQLSKFDQLVKARFVEMFGDVENNIFNFQIGSIGNSCSLKSGTSLPSDIENEGGTIPYVKVADMNFPGNERYITTSSRYVTAQTAGKGIFPAGSVVFPKRGGAIGTNKKRLTQRPICADLNVMGVIPGIGINPYYLLSYFDTVDLGSLDNGSSVPQVNNKDIAPLKLLLPPLSLQEEFATFVQKVDKTKTVVKQSLEKLETLKKSLMQEYFG